MQLDIIRVDENKKKIKPTNESTLGFGKIFSDHFFNMTHTAALGWHKATIEPYRALSLDPAAVVLHYAQEIFEGLKAYRGKDNSVYLFRSKDNFRRMNRSAARMCMPELDVDFVNDALKKLVLIDQEWIPRSRGTAMYIRPTMIATEPSVSVKSSDEFLFYILLGPAGNYYPEGFNPVKIYVSSKHIRAAKGGLGEAKTGANYAASLYTAQEAKKKGFTQVLWLDAFEHRYIEEVGAMNIFFRFKDEVVTSPLGGTILPGITRDSIIQLLKHWGMKVSERPITIDEVADGAQNGNLLEAFGAGTAAVISPVGEFSHNDKPIIVGQNKVGELSKKLYDELLAIQYGEKPEPFGWVERIG